MSIAASTGALVEARINCWYLGMAERRICGAAVARVFEVGMRREMYIMVRLGACSKVDLHGKKRVDGPRGLSASHGRATTRWPVNHNTMPYRYPTVCKR
jgi:hypothetical protein